MAEQTTLPEAAKTDPLPGEAAVAAPAQPAVPAPLSWLRNEIDRLFDDFGPARSARSIFAFPAVASLEPAMELAAVDGGYELTAELPGLDEKDLDIELADGMLTVSGEKREDSEKKEDGYLLRERRYGSFRRQLALPADVDPETIGAQFRNGVLTLSMKQSARTANQAKKIKIG